MTLEQVLIWGAIAGLYGWQFVHGTRCTDWRAMVSREIGEIKGALGIRDK